MKTYVVHKSTGEEGVIVGVNVDHLPAIIPRHHEEELRVTWLPKDSNTVGWSLNAHPFLAYIPIPCDFDCQLFRCLAYTRYTVPIVRGSDGLWRLGEELQRWWAQLQQQLSWFSQHLWGMTNVPFPLVFQVCRLPSSFGWDFAVNDEKYARKLAMRCRDAFVPLIAYTSMAISLHKPPATSFAAPKWAIELTRKFKMHPEFTRTLMNSKMGDFVTVRRVGVIIDVKTCHWLHLVPYLLHANVPVWLHWGVPGQEFKAPHPSIKSFLPSEGDVRLACHAQLDSSGSLTAENSRVLEMPPVLPQSGQKAGETWQDFFVRMERVRQERLAGETAEQRQEREKREWEQPRPGKGPTTPRLFYWEVVDMFRLR